MSDQPTPGIRVLNRFPDRSVRVEVVASLPEKGATLLFKDGSKNTVADVTHKADGSVVITWQDPPSRGDKGASAVGPTGRRR